MGNKLERIHSTSAHFPSSQRLGAILSTHIIHIAQSAPSFPPRQPDVLALTLLRPYYSQTTIEKSNRPSRVFNLVDLFLLPNRTPFVRISVRNAAAALGAVTGQGPTADSLMLAAPFGTNYSSFGSDACLGVVETIILQLLAPIARLLLAFGCVSCVTSGS